MVKMHNAYSNRNIHDSIPAGDPCYMSHPPHYNITQYIQYIQYTARKGLCDSTYLILDKTQKLNYLNLFVNCGQSPDQCKRC